MMMFDPTWDPFPTQYRPVFRRPTRRPPPKHNRRAVRANKAATTIQRAWHGFRKRREAAAAGVVLRALKRNLASASARRVVGSLRELARLRAEAEAVSASCLHDAKGRLVFEHTLERLLLETDAVDSWGSPFVRGQRRATVQALEKRLGLLDEE